MSLPNGSGGKWWFNGLTFTTVIPTSTNTPLGVQKYWFNGLPMSAYSVSEGIQAPYIIDSDIFYSLSPILDHYTDTDTIYATAANASPYYVNRGTLTATFNGSGSPTLGLPSNRVNGNLLIAWVHQAGGTPGTLSWSAGWTPFLTSSAHTKTALAYCVVTGSETAPTATNFVIAGSAEVTGVVLQFANAIGVGTSTVSHAANDTGTTTTSGVTATYVGTSAVALISNHVVTPTSITATGYSLNDSFSGGAGFPWYEYVYTDGGLTTGDTSASITDTYTLGSWDEAAAITIFEMWSTLVTGFVYPSAYIDYDTIYNNQIDAITPPLFIDTDTFYRPDFPGAVLWTPTQLSTVKLWLKGDTLTGTTGDAISTWTDASGTGNSATQSGSNRPTLQTAHQNSLNVVKFGQASSKYFVLPNAFTAYTQGAIAFVARLNVDPPTINQVNDGPIVKMGSEARNNSTNVYPYAGNNLIYDDFASTVRKDAFPRPVSSMAVYHVGGFRSKAADWRFFFNGTQIFNTTTNTVGWTTAPYVGRSINPGNDSYFDGFIGEIVFLNEFASTSDWQKLEGYLAHKWNTLATLDASHPYKTNPPFSYTASTLLEPSLVTATDTFYVPLLELGAAPEGPQPDLYVDTDAFFAPIVIRDEVLAAGLVTDADNFFVPDVFRDNRFIDVDIFYPFVTTTSLFPSWYREGDTVYSISVSHYTPLSPSLVADTDTIYVPRVGQEFIRPSLIVDIDAIHTTTISYSTPTLRPPFINADVVIYAPSVSKRNTLTPAIVTDTDVFRAPTILRGSLTLLPSRVIDPDIFRSPIVGIELVSENPPGGDPSNLPGNLKYVSKYLMPQSGLILSMDLRAGSAKTVNTRMVIYRDVAGVPGAMAGVTNDRLSVVSGVNNYTLVAPVSVLAGENIWMGLHSDGNFSWFLSNQPGGSRWNTDTWAGGASDPFGPVNIDNKKAPIVIYYLLSSNASITVDKVIDSDAFHAPTIISSKILLPPLIVDEFFYSPLVRSAWIISPELYDNTDVFHAPAITTRATIRPPLFAADDVFYSPFIAKFAPTVFSAAVPNDDEFYSPEVTVSGAILFPLRVAHDDVVHLPQRTGLNTVLPSLATISDVFFTPIVSKGAVTLAPQPVDSGVDFYAPEVNVFGGDLAIRPDQYIDLDVFYPPRKTGNAGWRRQVYILGTDIDDVDVIGVVPTPELVE